MISYAPPGTRDSSCCSPASTSSSPQFQYLQPVPVLARIAAESGDMEIGTDILQLPLLHPVQVAETVATLDQLCGGRFTLGVGLGYRPVEYGALCIWDEKQRDLMLLTVARGDHVQLGMTAMRDEYIIQPQELVLLILAQVLQTSDRSIGCDADDEQPAVSVDIGEPRHAFHDLLFAPTRWSALVFG